MTDPAPLAPPPPVTSVEPCWAAVHARHDVMRYRGAGRGPVVLVLQPSGADGARWPELLSALAAAHRVVVPELPAAGDDDLGAWLGGFLEGLGATGVTVVAAAPCARAALALARGDGEPLAGVVLIADPGEDCGGVPCALLRLAPALPAPTALQAVLRFVDGARAGSP